MAEIGENSVGGRGNLAVISRSWQWVFWKSRGFGGFCTKYKVRSNVNITRKLETRSESREELGSKYIVPSTKI